MTTVSAPLGSDKEATVSAKAAEVRPEGMIKRIWSEGWGAELLWVFSGAERPITASDFASFMPISLVIFRGSNRREDAFPAHRPGTDGFFPAFSNVLVNTLLNSIGV